MSRALVTLAASFLSTLAAALVACGSDSAPPSQSAADLDAGGVIPSVVQDASAVDPVDAAIAEPPPVDFGAEGPYPVGHVRFTVTYADGGRTLPVQVWYPAQESARAIAQAGVGLETLEPAGSSERATLAALVAAAPESCTRKIVHSAPDAAPAFPATGALPLVVFSHCHNCLRLSEAVVAERLASQGIAMAAPDHVSNTIYDGTAQLGAPFLAVRAHDISAVLDALLAPDSAEVPASLRGHFDATRVGAFGHSFGALTTGRVLQDDARVKSGFIMAAPIDTLVVTGAKPASVSQPALFMVAREDNSITEIGNQLIRSNYHDKKAPAWLVQVADAGHWSFSDIAGMTSAFAAGCGQGKRQTELFGGTFDYLANDLARSIAQRYVGAFFGYTLLNDAQAGVILGEPNPDGIVTVDTRL